MDFFDDLGTFEEQSPKTKAAPTILAPGIHKAKFDSIKIYESNGEQRMVLEFHIESGGRHYETIWANALSGEERSIKDSAIKKAEKKATIERDGQMYGVWDKKEYTVGQLVQKYVAMDVQKKITRLFGPVLTDSTAALLNGLSNGIAKGTYQKPNTLFDLAKSFVQLSGMEFVAGSADDKFVSLVKIDKNVAIKLTANYTGEKLGLVYGQKAVVASTPDRLKIVTDNGDFNDNMDYIVPSTEGDNLTAESADTPPIADAEEELDW